MMRSASDVAQIKTEWEELYRGRKRAQPVEIVSVGKGSNRCYLRGRSPLGLLNTVLGCLLNRVAVRCMDTETGRTVRWRWDRATDHPPTEGE